jgi:hypothetical protein
MDKSGVLTAWYSGIVGRTIFRRTKSRCIIPEASFLTTWFAPRGEVCHYGWTWPPGLNTLYCLEEWRGKQRISPPGDKIHSWRTTSPLGVKICPLGMRLRMALRQLCMHSIKFFLTYACKVMEKSEDQQKRTLLPLGKLSDQILQLRTLQFLWRKSNICFRELPWKRLDTKNVLRQNVDCQIADHHNFNFHMADIKLLTALVNLT